MPIKKHGATPPNEESGSLAKITSSTEIIWVDTGLRMDGLLDLDLRDVEMEVLRQEIVREITNPTPIKREMWSNCHMWTSSPQTHTLLKVSLSCTSFEDHEAVIKMIFKERSPTLRHVSRTHRAALDWIFDRINFDPKIDIKYVDTKDQLADMSTKGNLTRDEWNHLLHLLNFVNFSMFSCIHFLSNTKETVMTKRAENNSERTVGIGETKTNEFGVKEPPVCKERSSARFELS